MRRLQVVEGFAALRRSVRLGELSRAPLRLLRFQWDGAAAAVDWVIRAGDPMAAGLEPSQRAQLVTEQALRDALRLGELMMSELPGVEAAELRGFRLVAAPASAELMIAGRMTRDPPATERVRSLAMRAKLRGLHFLLSEGVLQPLREC